MIKIGSKVRCKANFHVQCPKRGKLPAPSYGFIYTVAGMKFTGFSLDTYEEVLLELEEFNDGEFNRSAFEEYEEPKEEIDFKDDKIIFL